MSGVVNQIVRTLDPRLDLQRGSKMMIEEGAENVELEFRNASSISSNQLSFDNINPGDPSIIVDRKMYVRTSYGLSFEPTCNRNNAEFTGIPVSTDAGRIKSDLEATYSVLGLGVSFGPRAFPFSQACDNIELRLNTQTFGYEIGRYIDPLMRYDNYWNCEKSDYSLCPSQQDTTKSYNNLFGRNVGEGVDLGGGNIILPHSNNLNPNAGYGTNTARVSRGSFLPRAPRIGDATVGAAPNNIVIVDARNIRDFIFDGWLHRFKAGEAEGSSVLIKLEYVGRSVNNTAGVAPAADFKADQPALISTEPIMIPILNFGKEDERGFYGINSITVRANLNNNLADRIYAGQPLLLNAYSGDGGAARTNGGRILSYGLSLGSWGFCKNEISQPQLFMNFLKPKILPTLPPANVYPREELTHKEEMKTVDVNGTANYSYTSTTIPTVPKRIYIWADRGRDNKTVLDPDTYMNLKNLTFRLSGTNTQYSGATIEQFYLQSKRNGLKMDFIQYAYAVGNVFCIDFGTDVSLPSGLYPGKTGSFNFTLKFDVADPAPQYNPSTIINPNEDRNKRNITPSNENYDKNIRLHIVYVEKGYSIIQPQTATKTTGLPDVDPNTIPISMVPPRTDWENMYGGSFIDDLKKAASKGVKKAKEAYETAKPYIEEYGPSVVKGVATALPLLAAGAGMSQKDAQNLVDKYGYDEAVAKMESMRKNKNKKKSAPKGGAKASKAGMKQRLDYY